MQYPDESALDARYLGTVPESPEEVADVLRKTKRIVDVGIFDREVVAYGIKGPSPELEQWMNQKESEQ